MKNLKRNDQGMSHNEISSELIIEEYAKNIANYPQQVQRYVTDVVLYSGSKGEAYINTIARVNALVRQYVKENS